MVEKSGIMPASGRTTVKRSLISRIFRRIPFQFKSFKGTRKERSNAFIVQWTERKIPDLVIEVQVLVEAPVRKVSAKGGSRQAGQLLLGTQTKKCITCLALRNRKR